MPNETEGELTAGDAPAPRAAIDTRNGWLQAVRDALLGLPDGPAREATLVDVDFDAWPLGEVPVVDALTRWLRQPGRKLRLVGLRFDGVARAQPRFVAWRRQWAHAVEVAAPTELEAGDVPSLLLLAQPPLAIELLDRERWRGRMSTEPRDVRLAMDRIAAILQRSEPAWPANELGL